MPTKVRREKQRRRKRSTKAETALLARASGDATPEPVARLRGVPFSLHRPTSPLLVKHHRHRLRHDGLVASGASLRDIARSLKAEGVLLSKMADWEQEEALAYHRRDQSAHQTLALSGRWQDVVFCRRCECAFLRQTDRREYCSDDCRRAPFTQERARKRDVAARLRDEQRSARALKELAGFIRWAGTARWLGCIADKLRRNADGAVVAFTFPRPHQQLSTGPLANFTLTLESDHRLVEASQAFALEAQPFLSGQ